MTGWLISHPTVLSSSRLIPPHVETVLTHSKCVLLPKVAGGGLVVVGGELPECRDILCLYQSIVEACHCLHYLVLKEIVCLQTEVADLDRVEGRTASTIPTGNSSNSSS